MSDPSKKAREENTERIKAVSGLIDAVVKLIWAAVIIIILAMIGKFLIWNEGAPFGDKEEEKSRIKEVMAPVEAGIVWDQIDKEIISALDKAQEKAEATASAELDRWIGELIVKMDEEFLDWYFSYWNQQKMGLMGLWYSARHWWDEDEYPEAVDEITQDIQEQFTKMVLRPPIAQREMENIADKTVQQYIVSLSEELERIPIKYEIPQSEWDKYLEEIALTTSDVEGNRQTPLTLKALTVGSLGGAALVAKSLATSLKPMISKIGTKLSSKMAAKAAAKTASKTGAKVAAKAGGKFFGSIVGIGIIAWDVYDHYNTRSTQKPILRRNLLDYFDVLKETLMYEPETGLMPITASIKNNILSSLVNRKKG